MQPPTLVRPQHLRRRHNLLLVIKIFSISCSLVFKSDLATNSALVSPSLSDGRVRWVSCNISKYIHNLQILDEKSMKAKGMWTSSTTSPSQPWLGIFAKVWAVLLLVLAPALDIRLFSIIVSSSSSSFFIFVCHIMTTLTKPRTNIQEKLSIARKLTLSMLSSPIFRLYDGQATQSVMHTLADARDAPQCRRQM